jgi:hypothetical protein
LIAFLAQMLLENARPLTLLLDSPGFTKIALQQLIEIDKIVTYQPHSDQAAQRYPLYHAIGPTEDISGWGQYAADDHMVTIAGESDEAYGQENARRPWRRPYYNNRMIFSDAEQNAFLAGLPITIPSPFMHTFSVDRMTAVTQAYEAEKRKWELMARRSETQTRELDIPAGPPRASATVVPQVAAAARTHEPEEEDSDLDQEEMDECDRETADAGSESDQWSEGGRKALRTKLSMEPKTARMSKAKVWGSPTQALVIAVNNIMDLAGYENCVLSDEKACQFTNGAIELMGSVFEEALGTDWPEGDQLIRVLTVLDGLKLGFIGMADKHTMEKYGEYVRPYFQVKKTGGPAREVSDQLQEAAQNNEDYEFPEQLKMAFRPKLDEPFPTWRKVNAVVPTEKPNEVAEHDAAEEEQNKDAAKDWDAGWTPLPKYTLPPAIDP